MASAHQVRDSEPYHFAPSHEQDAQRHDAASQRSRYIPKSFDLGFGIRDACKVHAKIARDEAQRQKKYRDERENKYSPTVIIGEGFNELHILDG